MRCLWKGRKVTLRERLVIEYLFVQGEFMKGRLLNKEAWDVILGSSSFILMRCRIVFGALQQIR
jgi:hypothetical protein